VLLIVTIAYRDNRQWVWVHCSNYTLISRVLTQYANLLITWKHKIQNKYRIDRGMWDRCAWNGAIPTSNFRLTNKSKVRIFETKHSALKNTNTSDDRDNWCYDVRCGRKMNLNVCWKLWLEILKANSYLPARYPNVNYVLTQNGCTYGTLSASNACHNRKLISQTQLRHEESTKIANTKLSVRFFFIFKLWLRSSQTFGSVLHQV
jgi:hypothetical protein